MCRSLLANTFDQGAAAAKSLQSCPTLCDPIDGSPPGSPVPGILQARTLEWVAISFSNAGKWKVKVRSLSRVRLLATPWTAAHQAPPSMGFSRQEFWSGVPLPWVVNKCKAKILKHCWRKQRVKKIANAESVSCEIFISCFLCACWLDALGDKINEPTIFHWIY